LFNANSDICHLYHGELIFNEMMIMRSALYYTNTQLDFYSAGSLKQSAERHVVPLGHIILIPSQFSGFSWREQVKFQ